MKKLIVVTMLLLAVTTSASPPGRDLFSFLADIGSRFDGIEEQVTGTTGYSEQLIRLVHTWAKRTRKWLGQDVNRHSPEDDCFTLEGHRRELAKLVQIARDQGTGGDAVSKARVLMNEMDQLWKDHCGGGGPGTTGERATAAWNAATDKLKDARAREIASFQNAVLRGQAQVNAIGPSVPATVMVSPQVVAYQTALIGALLLMPEGAVGFKLVEEVFALP